ncbi:hypothetical protein E3N88_16276 [Mikania micrantha]|uniref:Uncharacterized protein n=1 Tax=Mikania micrantha TaxID=192012 RepID=A0A5N6P0L0_9ASTR|nr:hypothetical protein E3N88_16276 [Mikania micrantha]
MKITERRSASYPPTLWSNDFIQSLSSKFTGEKYEARSQTLKEVLRNMICEGNEMVENPLGILNLIDDLQRLGIAYHFTREISSVLENINCNCLKNHEEWSKMDLNLKSLGFRLLRQHGYSIPQVEIFKDNIDENGTVMGHLNEDIMSMLNLYEATYHSLENESILDNARIFTKKFLKQSIEKIADKNILSLIYHALDFPLHWMLPRVETRWFIEVYDKRNSMNPMVLELAKLDFNMVQAVYQEDLKQASRWWKNTCWNKFSFARDRLVENFMWSVSKNYLPGFKGRVDMTKVNAMITTLDDVYDVYGTLQELEQFTNIVNSWDLNEITELPDYMKICFLLIYNEINEMSYNILANEGTFVLPYLKKAWQDLCNSYIIEARWFNSKYTPTLNEFLDNASMSVAMIPVIKHAYLLTLTNVIKDTLQQIERADNLIRNTCLIARLTNDMGTSLDELERGDVPKSIQCYMHESGATEMEAREYIKGLIMETWKKLNKERQDAIGSELPHEFIECVTNLARMGHFMYTDGDKHGKPEMFKPYALSLFVDPILAAAEGGNHTNQPSQEEESRLGSFSCCKKKRKKNSQRRFEPTSNLKVEDVDEDDAEVEVKQDKEKSQPKIQGGSKENHEDGVKSQIAKKDGTPKKQAPSVWNPSKGKEEKRCDRPRLQPHFTSRGGTLQPGFSVPRKHVTESEKTPHAGEKRKEIFILHQLRPTVALKRPRDTGGVKRNSANLQPWMEQDISFPPIRGGNFASNPLTISVIIAGHNIYRVYVDTGSALEIMYEHCFLQFYEVIQRSLVKSTHVLTGFAGKVVQPIGQIQLPVVVGNETGQREVTMTFLVIIAQSSYDIILGRPGLCLLGAIALTIHSAIKFSTPRGVVTLKSNRRSGEEWSVKVVPSERNKHSLSIEPSVAS